MDNTVVIMGERVRLVQVIALKHALRLECLGMVHSKRGVSAYKTLKRMFQLKGNKRLVLAQVDALIEQLKSQIENGKVA